MDDRAERLLATFIEGANKETLHVLDWGRFYDFILAVHREKLQASEGEVGTRLWASGFPGRVADRLQAVFTRGLDLLVRHDERRG